MNNFEEEMDLNYGDTSKVLMMKEDEYKVNMVVGTEEDNGKILFLVPSLSSHNLFVVIDFERQNLMVLKTLTVDEML